MPFILPFCKKLADAVYIFTSLIYIITCHSKQVPLLPGYLHEFFTDLCIHFIKILQTCLIQFSFDRNGIIKHYYAYTRKYNYCHAYCYFLYSFFFNCPISFLKIISSSVYKLLVQPVCLHQKNTLSIVVLHLLYELYIHHIFRLP